MLPVSQAPRKQNIQNHVIIYMAVFRVAMRSVAHWNMVKLILSSLTIPHQSKKEIRFYFCPKHHPISPLKFFTKRLYFVAYPDWFSFIAPPDGWKNLWRVLLWKKMCVMDQTGKKGLPKVPLARCPALHFRNSEVYCSLINMSIDSLSMSRQNLDYLAQSK